MKTLSIDVQYGTKEKNNQWELKGVEMQIPETLAEWVEWLDEERIVKTLETYHTIRLQDYCRRLHNGGKNTKGHSDKEIRDLAPSFRLFEKRTVIARPRELTPDELKAQQKAHLASMDKDARARYLAELVAGLE